MNIYNINYRLHVPYSNNANIQAIVKTSEVFQLSGFNLEKFFNPIVKDKGGKNKFQS